MATLERAIEIAAEAHAGQLDKAGEPYILNPIRVMLRMSTEEQRIVAVLHDVFEDSPWTTEDLTAECYFAKGNANPITYTDACGAANGTASRRHFAGGLVRGGKRILMTRHELWRRKAPNVRHFS